MDLFWKIFATLALVVMNAFFVVAEFAAVGARLSHLQELAQERALARVALRIKRDLDLYLSSCQLGVTLASLGLGAVTEPVVSAVLIRPLHLLHISTAYLHAIGFIGALAITTLLHIVLGEQAPKNWAIRYSERLLQAIAPPLVLFTYLFYPAIWVLNTLTNTLLRWTGVATQSMTQGLPHSEEELRALVAQAGQLGVIAKGRQQLLESAFEFADLKVRQIMTPRTQVDYLLLDQPIGPLLQTIQKSEYTRFPLCDGDFDHVVGLVHMKDLFGILKLIPGRLRFTDQTVDNQPVAVADGLPGSAVHVIGSGDIDLRKIKRDVLFVPELLSAPRLLRQFQTQHIHMAVVVDEYGATLGIVTLEDVLEEIVGEIEDEFDRSAGSNFIVEGTGRFRVSGLMPIHDLRDKLGPDTLEDADGVDTLSGYVVKRLGRWPKVNDVIPIGSYSAKVMTVLQKRRVGQVLLTRQDAAKAEPEKKIDRPS